jgi:predicted RNase H-like nuclease
MVELFSLEKIIKYKKGAVSAKRLGLEELRGRLAGLTKAEPRIVMNDALKALLATDLEKLAGRALKNHEDILDALFCAYLAYYFWYWGWERNRLFGDYSGGLHLDSYSGWRALVKENVSDDGPNSLFGLNTSSYNLADHSSPRCL